MSGRAELGFPEMGGGDGKDKNRVSPDDLELIAAIFAIAAIIILGAMVMGMVPINPTSYILTVFLGAAAFSHYKAMRLNEEALRHKKTAAMDAKEGACILLALGEIQHDHTKKMAFAVVIGVAGLAGASLGGPGTRLAVFSDRLQLIAAALYLLFYGLYLITGWRIKRVLRRLSNQ